MLIHRVVLRCGWIHCGGEYGYRAGAARSESTAKRPDVEIASRFRDRFSTLDAIEPDEVLRTLLRQGRRVYRNDMAAALRGR
jgi:hypothetical protein